MRSRLLSFLVMGVIAGIAFSLAAPSAVPTNAEPLVPVISDVVLQPVFGLPFNDPAGPSTWYVIQYYGNTRSAYTNRVRWYSGGQGLHFGIDFAAKCGTEVAAIGDGIVLKVDAAEHGAGPHNLVIKHDNGYASFYGHLLERPPFAPFTSVKRGQVVGLTGDPDLTCTSRPHLHLEVRSDSLYQAYNPVLLIDADWDNLGVFGPLSGFQYDLENPRQWMLPYDQPEVSFGQGLLNDYAATWPPDW